MTRRKKQRVASGIYALHIVKSQISIRHFRHASNFLFSFAVKPTVSLPGDATPEMSGAESDQEETQATGDLAELSANVGVPTASKPKKGKNKGVGKGCSGSSGPPTKRPRKNNLVQQPAQHDFESEEEVEVDELAPQATQHITVGVKKGYSVYPGYLFDVSPKRIKVDHLRKQFMINEIARAKAE